MCVNGGLIGSVCCRSEVVLVVCRLIKRVSGGMSLRKEGV